MELLPRHSRFETRYSAPPAVLAAPIPRVVSARPRFASLAQGQAASKIEPPAGIAPQPTDLIPIIRGGIGGVPTVYTSWANVLAAAGGAAATQYVYMGNSTAYALAAGTTDGQRVEVKDNLYISGNTPITVTATLEHGMASVVLSTPGEALAFVWSATNGYWSIF